MNIDPNLQKIIDDIEEAENDVDTTSDNQEVDNQEVDSQEVDSQEVDSQEVDSQEVDSQEVDSQEVDSQEVDSQEVDSQEVDLNEKEILDPEVYEDEIESQKKEIQHKLLSLLDKHHSSAIDMYEEAKEDRKEIDRFIAILIPKIQNNDYKSADIQSLAALMQTKVDITRNRAYQMDAVSKLLAALKNNDTINSGGGNGDDDDLTQEEANRLLGGDR